MAGLFRVYIWVGKEDTRCRKYTIASQESIPGGKKVLWRSHVSRVIGDCLWSKGWFIQSGQGWLYYSRLGWVLSHPSGGRENVWDHWFNP